jgi:glutathione synthase/RimK-type ligase-like ATP-grasp enzyme
MRSIFVGVPGSRRANLWRDALRSRGSPAAEEVGYLDVLKGNEDLSVRGSGKQVVRLDSPDDDLETNAAILAAGAAPLEDQRGTPVDDEQARRALTERGRIVQPRQWYLGFQALMSSISVGLRHARGFAADRPPLWIVNDPNAVSALYDKLHCKRVLRAAGIPQPCGERAVTDWNDVRSALAEADRGRVMVKLSYGSAAAGAMAIEAANGKMRALTTAELVTAADGPRAYVTRRIRTLVGEAEIGKLIDVMSPWGLFAEAWLPKDRWPDGRRYDLRVLTIQGEPCHAVARISRSPFTNLNLLNERADASALRVRDWWPEVEDVCRRTAAAFPEAFHLGIDVLVTPHGRNVYVLEANAFGDLLPGIRHHGLTTHETELAALEAEAA